MEGWSESVLRREIKRGTSKPPNSFQIKNLEGDIWTFEQIDKLQQSPTDTPKTIFQWLGYSPGLLFL